MRYYLLASLCVFAAARPDGTSDLHIAAENADATRVASLLKSGADANAANRYGVTPLMLAATSGDARVVDLLLKAKADPNAALPEGETVLMNAARAGNAQVVKLLLAAGAKPNAQEKWRGQSALMWAAAEGHAEAIAMLVEFGADSKMRSTAGFTPLLYAAREGKPEAVRALLKAGANVNETLPVNVRFRRGGQAQSDNVTGPSPLLLAVANAHYELASMLLDAGADAKFAGPGWNALHIVTWVRKPGQGSNDPAPVGSGKMTSIEIVRKLVAKGADINLKMTRRSNAGLSSLNTIGATPFLSAARTADVELMKLFVSLGADPKIANADGTTPLMVAAGLGTRSPGEDAGTEEEALDAVKYCLSMGLDVNAIDNNGNTAVHGAAFKHLPSVTEHLLASGTKVAVYNQKNNQGWTPLRISDGVHRGMNLRSSPATSAVLRKHMTAAGVSTEVEPEINISGATR